MGPVRRSQLESAGVRRIGHLLAGLPLRYEDRSRSETVESLGAQSLPEDPVGLVGRLEAVRAIPLRRRNMRLVEGRIVTDAGDIKGVWFNRPYLAKQVKDDQIYRFFGKVREGRQGLEMVNASLEKVDGSGDADAEALRPVYSRIGEVGPSQVAKLVATAVDRLAEEGAEDQLPGELLERHGLPGLAESLVALHGPSEALTLEQLVSGTTLFHARLAYGELFKQQLQLLRRRESQQQERRRDVYRTAGPDLEALCQLLPFELTGAQRRVFGELVADLERDRPMWRLVQGDVGCGKTAIALLSLMLAVRSGLQAAFMAPTEILAEQHAKQFRALLPGDVRQVFLSGQTRDAKAVRETIRLGQADLAIGTHALFQESVEFARLGLVVIDEQHRFGVGQREQLVAKGEAVDLLVMTATPIPRSLALTLYGDLDVSVVDELPPGRQPVVTELVSEPDRESAFHALADEVSAGGQAYYVVPLIEPSEEVAAQSVESVEAEIRSIHPELKMGVVHGRLRPEQRDEVMARFKGGQLDVLLATTVIEVGVDVANASLMVIDSAERFGLSQLHQLRGRVGRGSRESRCLAVCGAASPESFERLEIFASCTDGFELAEADLLRRGPGDVLGRRQSGQPFFRFANPVRDVAWLLRAREDAKEWLSREDGAQLARSVAGSRVGRE